MDEWPLVERSNFVASLALPLKAAGVAGVPAYLGPPFVAPPVSLPFEIISEPHLDQRLHVAIAVDGLSLPPSHHQRAVER